MNGGYVMIDCTGLDLTKGSIPQTITGLYDKVKKAYAVNKPIFAINCNWGDSGKVTPIEVFAIDFTDYIICTASTLQVVITPADAITIINMVQA